MPLSTANVTCSIFSMCDTFMRLIRRECFSKYICAFWWFLLYCLYKANMKEQRYTAQKKVLMFFCVCIFVFCGFFWTGNNIFPWFSWDLIGYHTKAVMILGDLFWPFLGLIHWFWRSTSDNKQGLFGQKKNNCQPYKPSLSLIGPSVASPWSIWPLPCDWPTRC